MNANADSQWLEKFRLVRVMRQIEEDIHKHKRQMGSAAGHDASWDRALVDWTIHSTHAYNDLKHDSLVH